MSDKNVFDDYEDANNLDTIAEKLDGLRADAYTQGEKEKEHLLELGLQEGVIPAEPVTPMSQTPYASGAIDVSVNPLAQIPTSVWDVPIPNSLSETPDALVQGLGLMTEGDTPANMLANNGSIGNIFQDAMTPVVPQTGVPVNALPKGASMADVVAPATFQVQNKEGTSTKVSNSPELQKFNEAQQKQDVILGAIDIASKKQAESLAALDEIAAPFDQARAQRAAQTAQFIAEQNKLALDRYTQSVKDVDNIRAQMAQQDWSSYWGSKSTGDKILLGLAMGMGAYSQAKIGGQNVALQVVDSMIEDHDRTRKAKFNALQAQLTAASNSGQDALKGAQELAKMEGAARLADYEKLDQQYNMLARKAKTQGAQAEIMMKSAEMKSKIVKEQASLYAQLAGHSIETRDILSAPKGYSEAEIGTNKIQNNQFVPMSKEERTSFATGKSMARLNKNLDMLEDDVVSDPKYVQMYNELVNVARGTVAENLSGLAAAAKLGSAIDRATLGNPGLQQYGANFKELVNLITRSQTGAAMSPSELAENFELALPKPTRISGSLEASKQLRDSSNRPTRYDWARREWIASGTPLKLYFDAEQQ